MDHQYLIREINSLNWVAVRTLSGYHSNKARASRFATMGEANTVLAADKRYLVGDFVTRTEDGWRNQ